MTAERDDWIILGVKGEIYPCKPDIFAATYEHVGVDSVERDTVSPEAAEQAETREREPSDHERVVRELLEDMRDDGLYEWAWPSVRAVLAALRNTGETK